jgi:hypothetical protein
VVAATAILHQVEGNLVVDNIVKPTTLRSERSKSSADVHFLQKAEKVAAKKNLESPGNLQRDVLATFLGPVAA